MNRDGDLLNLSVSAFGQSVYEWIEKGTEIVVKNVCYVVLFPYFCRRKTI